MCRSLLQLITDSRSRTLQLEQVGSFALHRSLQLKPDSGRTFQFERGAATTVMMEFLHYGRKGGFFCISQVFTVEKRLTWNFTVGKRRCNNCKGGIFAVEDRLTLALALSTNISSVYCGPCKTACGCLGRILRAVCTRWLTISEAHATA